MDLEDELTQAEVSMFESGKRIPNLLVLRKYAVLAGIWTDYLIEDGIDFPKIPGEMNKVRLFG